MVCEEEYYKKIEKKQRTVCKQKVMIKLKTNNAIACFMKPVIFVDLY